MEPEPHLRKFSALLDVYPAAFSGNPLYLVFLDDVSPILSGSAYLRQLDGLSLMEERREYLLDESVPWPFPQVFFDGRPDPGVLSASLFERFDDAQRVVQLQSQLAHRIESTVKKTRPSIVALIIVDGLSYYDLPQGTDADPCLVAGVTTTQYGYRAVVGRPSISRRLFALGYAQQLGFTYYDIETDPLSQDIYDVFGSSQIVRVRSFDEVLLHLERVSLSHAYIQLTLAGLDQLCHSHRDRPPRDRYLEQILSHYDDLIDCLSAKGAPVLVYLTADHGILWREHVEDNLVVVSDLLPGDIRFARYVKGRILRPYGRCCTCFGHNYTLLGVPHMTREFRSNEWGVHGGISAWESIVPLMERKA